MVYNHLGPEGNYLREFGPYFSDRYRTAWGEGFNLDGPDSDEVRRYLVDNAVYWIDEFHLDGLRLDAADRIVDLSPVHLAEEIGAAVHRQGAAAGRRTVVIAEIDSNDPRWVRPREVGGFGLDGHWSDDFHHAVHVALTGERGGYYADFGGVGPVARALGRRYVHDGGYSPFRRRRHGRPADDLAGDRFVVCVQNHDQVGNRAGGERLAALVEPAGVRLAAAILLLAPYVPLLFMGEEYAECNPFLYFVSHGDPALIEAVREGRRREFAAFGWRGEVPDPQSEATFAASRPHWERAGQGEHAAVLALYRDLLRLRRALPLLRPGAAEPAVRHDEREEWVAMRLRGGGQTLDAVFNFATDLRDVPGSGPALPTFCSTPTIRDTAGRGGSARPTVASRFHLAPPRCSGAGRDPGLARSGGSPRRHVGRRGDQLRDLLRARHGGGALSLRPPRRRPRGRAHPAPRAHRSDLARVPPRRAARPALRLPGARTLRPRRRDTASIPPSCSSIPTPGPSAAPSAGATRSRATA